MKHKLLKKFFGVLVIYSSTIAAVTAAELTATWTLHNPLHYFPDGPGPRAWTNLTFNSDSGNLLLFAGASTHYYGDIWEYDTLADIWTPIDLPDTHCPGYYGFDGPDGRDTQAVQYDPVNSLLWTVAGGGGKCGSSTPYVLADRHTITAAPDTMTLIDTTLPQDVDIDYFKDWSVTANAQLAYIDSYDPATQTLTLSTPITGLAAGMTYRLRVYTSSSTFYYSPTSGEWRSFDGPRWGYDGPNPNRGWGRNTPAFAFSPRDQAMVMFGGSVSGNGTNETWMLDLTDKSNPAHPAAWVEKHANSWTSPDLPPRRNEINDAMVYDSVNDVFILFGGRCKDPRCANDAAGDTWAYKLSTNTWTQMNPPVSPPGRIAHQMYFDSDLGVVVMYGGTSYDFYTQSPPEDGYFKDLWIYNYATNTWTELQQPVLQPSGRTLGSLTYDPVAKAAILYGGTKYPRIMDFDLWKLTLTRDGAPGNEPPVAAAQATPTSGQVDTEFAVSSAGSFDPDGTLTSYVWNFGDGNIGSGQAATHIYSDPGIYTIILTVTDNDRATASDSTFVTVEVPNQGPTANFNYSCTSLSCTFSDTSSDVDGSIASRTWSFGDGAGATTQTASHTYSAGGTYAVTLTVTDDDGATDSTQKSVTLTTSGDVTLTVGATDPGAYGNNFGSNQHATELVASFQGTGL